MNLLQLSEAMIAASVSVEETLGRGIEEACVILEKSAKDAIGTYEFGWPPLQPETVARKANGDTPLLETGELRASITHNSDKTEGYVGTDNPKGLWHEFGTSRGIPPRPFLGGAMVKDEAKIVELIGNSVAMAITAK